MAHQAQGPLAHILVPSSLPIKPTSCLCTAFVQGFCRHGLRCTRSHEICRVEGQHNDLPVVPASRNQISSLRRFTPSGCSPFDDDGPGELSLRGARHDNDWADFTRIQILPSTDEILCSRPPYMPPKDGPSILTGRERHLDTLFRHLRYESTESLIDANYYALQLLSGLLPDMPCDLTNENYDERLVTPKGVRFHAYRDVRLEDVIFDIHKSLMIQISFACPRALRGGRLVELGRLEEGMLVTLVGHSTMGLSTTFMEVHLRLSTFALKSRHGARNRAGAVLSFAQTRPGDVECVRRVLYNRCGLLNENFLLVEVPGTLVAGFYHTLRSLQMQQESTCSFAFQDVIAPESVDSGAMVSSPNYTHSEDFAFDLSCLGTAQDTNEKGGLKPKLALQDTEYLDRVVNQLQKDTTLDQGQAIALCEGLSRDFALIQGAPGAGKTFLGVALARVLLSANNTGQNKPILVTALTNHALDSYLEDLKEAGIGKFARLGSMSKETWVKQHELRNLSSKFKPKIATSRMLAMSHNQQDSLWNEGTSWCESLNDSDILSWPAVRELLSQTDNEQLASFIDLEDFADEKLSNVRLARKTGGFAYEHWCMGKDLEDTEALIEHFRQFAKESFWPSQASKEDNAELDTIFAKAITERAESLRSGPANDLWKLTLPEREAMIEDWKSQIKIQTIYDRTAEIHRRHQVASRNKRDALDERDLDILSQQDIIAMTTTIASRQWHKLKTLGIQIVICEEAAEVSEAQFLSSLLPTVSHCIMIGDPLQLRPMVNERSLSLETEQGGRYRLDESLMERLMYPSDPKQLAFPASKLLYQRRMHPSISHLLRKTLYPHLLDHRSTYERAAVPGLADRVFWLSHHESEGTNVKSDHPTSYTNQYELDMISGLVEYLVSSNDFDYQDITILTPYNGQLAAFHQQLRSKCSIWLSERDRETLIDEGLLGEDEFTNDRKTVELSGMLRLATVDNFQGEESRVVILSLVRSNDEGRVGFLKTNNRINVAISRARNGLYVIGNASIMQNESIMWKTIVEELSSRDQIGPSIRICCPRHNTPVHLISRPEQWQTIPACQKPCQFTFSCGHRCQECCHSLTIHEREGRQACKQISVNRELPCGHKIEVTCEQVSSASMEFKCAVIVGKRSLECGHSQDRLCSDGDQSRPCKETCRVELECGHICEQVCGDCRSSGHSCNSGCGTKSSCGHTCGFDCHPFVGCPPCQQPCQQKCSHGQCDRSCREPCRPCLKKCTTGCEHTTPCASLCCLPCTTLPCSKICEKILDCGHRCSTLCGEICLCIQCAPEDDLPSLPAVRLPCGHLFQIAALDKSFALPSVYEIDGAGVITGFASEFPESVIGHPIACPACGLPCDSIRRYDIFKKLGSLRRNLDFADELWAKSHFRHLEMIKAARKELTSTAVDFGDALKPGPLSINRNRKMVTERSSILESIEAQIHRFIELDLIPYDSAVEALQSLLNKLGPGFQPMPSLSLRSEALEYRAILLTLDENCAMLRSVERLSGLRTQCRSSTILAEGIKRVTIPSILKKLEGIDQCILECQQKHMKRLEAELTLYKIARGLTLEKADFPTPSEDLRQDLEKVKDLCHQYPSTAGLFQASCKRVHELLTDSDARASYLSKADADHAIFFRTSENHWWEWPRFKPGSRTICNNGHIYVRESTRFCTECGPSRKTEEELESARVKEAKLQAQLLPNEDHLANAAKQWALGKSMAYRPKPQRLHLASSWPNSPSSERPVLQNNWGNAFDLPAVTDCGDPLKSGVNTTETHSWPECNGRPGTTRCISGHMMSSDDWSPCSECANVGHFDVDWESASKVDKSDEDEAEASLDAEAAIKQKEQTILPITYPDQENMMAAHAKTIAELARKYTRSKNTIKAQTDTVSAK